MKRDETRRRLIEGTIHVIADEGLDKASANLIGISTATNKASIYRCFSDKEDMFAQAFETLDDEILSLGLQHIQILYMQELEYETRCYLYFSAVWKFLLENRDKCLTFVQYYYSRYFTKYKAAARKRKYAPLLEKFKDIFTDEADVWMIYNYMLKVLLDFAVMVHNSYIPKDDDSAACVFRLIYGSFKQYFRNSKVC